MLLGWKMVVADQCKNDLRKRWLLWIQARGVTWPCSWSSLWERSLIFHHSMVAMPASHILLIISSEDPLSFRPTVIFPRHFKWHWHWISFSHNFFCRHLLWETMVHGGTRAQAVTCLDLHSRVQNPRVYMDPTSLMSSLTLPSSHSGSFNGGWTVLDILCSVIHWLRKIER